MTTEPIAIPIPVDNGMEETPAGPMSTEWLDEVWEAYMTRIGLVPVQGRLTEPLRVNFSGPEFALLAQMQGVGAEEAAERLCGEGEE